MRWSQVLRSPALVAGPSKDKPCQVSLGPDDAGRKAYADIFLDGEFLEVSILAEGVPDANTRPDHPEWENRAYLAVMLDAGHDHATRRLYAVGDRGDLTAEATWAVPGEEMGDTGTPSQKDPPPAEGTFEYEDTSRFTARLRIPAGDLWRDPETPAGLAIRVGFHEACIPAPLAWPERVPWAGDMPLAYADMYRDEPAVHVTEIDFGEPTWGADGSPVTLRGRLAAEAPCSGRVQARIVLPGDSEADQDGAAWDCAGDDLEIQVPLVFPFRAKWANGLAQIARLHLSIVGEGEQVLWQGSYPFGFDHGIIVRERFEPGASGLAPRPEPSNPDFLEAMRRYILTRIPDYKLRTTREDAPSDFYLEDPAGEANLDLSAEDALDQTAGLLTDRFPDWQDALCAVAMWIHHPMITRHSSTWSRVSNVASVDTIPRLGGCFCGDTARLGACLAEMVGTRLGVDLKGLSMGLRGHLGTLVETPIGAVVIDGMLGLWFHTLDNTRLATLDEMRACREITERVWYAPRAAGHEFFYGVHDQLIRPWRDGPMRWPEATT